MRRSPHGPPGPPPQSSVPPATGLCSFPAARCPGPLTTTKTCTAASRHCRWAMQQSSLSSGQRALLYETGSPAPSCPHERELGERPPGLRRARLTASARPHTETAQLGTTAPHPASRGPRPPGGSASQRQCCRGRGPRLQGRASHCPWPPGGGRSLDHFGRKGRKTAVRPDTWEPLPDAVSDSPCTGAAASR